jgi:hypothetical protein
LGNSRGQARSYRKKREEPLFHEVSSMGSRLSLSTLKQSAIPEISPLSLPVNLLLYRRFLVIHSAPAAVID